MASAAANRFSRLPGGKPCIWLKPYKSPWGSARLRTWLVDTFHRERNYFLGGPEKELLARRRVSDCLGALMPAVALPEGLHFFVARSKWNAAAECPVAFPFSPSYVLAFPEKYAPRLRLAESRADSASTCLRVLQSQCLPCADRRGDERFSAGSCAGFPRNSKHKFRDRQSDSADEAAWDRRAGGPEGRGRNVPQIWAGQKHKSHSPGEICEIGG